MLLMPVTLSGFIWS